LQELGEGPGKKGGSSKNRKNNDAANQDENICTCLMRLSFMELLETEGGSYEDKNWRNGREGEVNV
jgi:hypothetical protein